MSYECLVLLYRYNMSEQRINNFLKRKANPEIFPNLLLVMTVRTFSVDF